MRISDPYTKYLRFGFFGGKDRLVDSGPVTGSRYHCNERQSFIDQLFDFCFFRTMAILPNMTSLSPEKKDACHDVGSYIFFTK